MYMPLSRRVVLLVRSRAKALTLTVLAIGIIELRNIIRGGSTLLATSLGDTFAILCLALPLIFASGVVSGDFRRGMPRLWLQKPIDPVRFYLSRFLEGLLVSLVLALLALGVTRLGIAALGQPDETSQLLGHLPYVLIFACVVFGFSSWISRGSTLVAIGFLGAGAVAREMGSADLLGRPWNWLVEALLVPIPAIREFRAFLVGVSDAFWIPLAQILAYSIGWTALGALGVWYTVNKGKLPHVEQS